MDEERLELPVNSCIVLNVSMLFNLDMGLYTKDNQNILARIQRLFGRERQVMHVVCVDICQYTASIASVCSSCSVPKSI